MKLMVGDDISGMKIFEIINKYFGQNYTGWMKAWYDINDEYAAWFPTITETNSKPNGTYGGTKSYSNTLSADGKTILEINHDSENDEGKYDTVLEKKRFVFGRINGTFQFLGIFKRTVVKNATHATFRHERIAVGIDIDTYTLIKDKSTVGKNVSEWFISGNPKEYDLFGAFHDLGKVDWKQTFNLSVDDIVYIYVSKSYHRVMIKCKVNKTDINVPEIDDNKYDLSGKYDGTYGRYMELEPIAEFDTELFDRLVLEKYGFTAPQGHLRVKNNTKEYLDVVQYLLNVSEIVPDKYDGSYELARETVRAYQRMNNLADVDYRDLNLLYHMVIGTWKMSIEQKKKSVDKSNLPFEEKSRLKGLLDEVWQRAVNKEYEHDGVGDSSIGMFGTGFYSFDSKDEGLAARTFLGLCIDIIDLNDDEEIFDIVDKYFTQELLGLKAASASAMLHCLKPYTFPILNTNFGNNTIYEYFGIDLTKMKNLTTYSLNCRKIKAFRDKYFKVKNYRIYDKAARMVNKAVSNTKINYIGVLDYLENNRWLEYMDPSKTTDPVKRENLLELKSRGQSAVAELKSMADLCKDKYDLDVCSPIQWLDGSNTKTRDYLWVQMKFSSHIEKPELIAIFVEMSERTDRPRYRFSLEIKRDVADKAAYEEYHKHFDMSLPEDGTLGYFGGKSKYNRSMLLNEDTDSIKGKIDSGEYSRVQISSIEEWDDDLTNDDYEQAMLDGIGKLIPYYEYVIGKSGKVESEQTDYWPSYEEYPNDITKDDWKRFIEEVEYPNHKGSVRVLKCYLDIGGIASPKKMSETYKGHSMVYIGSVSNFSRRALKYFGKEPCVDIKDGKQWLFPIAFQGKIGDGADKGTYVYKMRQELMDALKAIDLSGIDLEYKKDLETMNDNLYELNTILYGPPGTGKTYSSILYAVGICDDKPIEELKDEDYGEVLSRFDELRTEGRIAFTTFHQSYGYEEFIEGIKPIVDEDGDENDNISYSIEDGLFKRFCTQAVLPSQATSSSENYGLNKNPSVWKVSLEGTGDNPTRTECLENSHIRIGWDGYGEVITDDTDFYNGGRIVLNSFINKMQVGDVVLSCYSASTVDAIGVVTGEYEWHPEYPAHKRLRKVKWLAKNVNYNIVELNSGTSMTLATVYKMKLTITDVFKILEDVGASSDTSSEFSDKKYVFIIDEINRGNISKIFGELITLIEPSKRIGKAEEIRLELPYSRKKFGVPGNVYILGTMNTADRSIALMDMALRRRFQFVEMMPDTEVLKDISVEQNGETLDIAKMLEIINLRIEYLYDREHTIGHAYFMPLLSNPSIEKLAEIFDMNLIPLLKEYFYEDYGKIQIVLGDNKKSSDDLKFIKETKLVTKDIFNGDTSELDLPEQIYSIQKEALYNIRSYKEISKDL